MSTAAEANLHALVWPTIVQWAQFWRAAGVTSDQLQAALWVYGSHWHPDGALARPGGEKQAIEDALSEASRT